LAINGSSSSHDVETDDENNGCSGSLEGSDIPEEANFLLSGSPESDASFCIDGMEFDEDAARNDDETM